jgi:hypothetical protein
LGSISGSHQGQINLFNLQNGISSSGIDLGHDLVVVLPLRVVLVPCDVLLELTGESLAAGLEGVPP